MDAIFLNTINSGKMTSGYLSSQVQIISNKYFSSKKLFHIKFKVYKFLEYPSGIWQNLYHFVLFLLTFVVFTLSIFLTINRPDADLFYKIYLSIEILLFSIYFTEFILRVWSCSIIEKYRGKNCFRYIYKFSMLIDLLILLINISMIIILYLPSHYDNISIIFLNSLQILRLMRSERHYGTLSLMYKVLKSHRNELITGYCCGILLIAITSCIVYLSERSDSKNQSLTMPESIYMTFITFYTIGYGDVVPSLTLTKIIIVFFAVFGIAFVALPSGIIGSGFAIAAANRARKQNKRVVYKPAINVIQAAIRSYLYQFDDSAVVKNDFNILKKNPKSGKIFFSKIKEFTKGDSDNFGSQPSNKLYFTVSSGPEARQILEKLQLGKSRFFNKYQSAELTPDVNEKFEKIGILCCLFIRRLYLHAKISKFKRIKQPDSSIDENLRLIQNRQENCAFFLNEVIKSLKTNIRNFIASENALNVDTNQVKFVSENINVNKTSTNIRTDVDNLFKRVDNLEKLLNDAIEKVSKQKKDDIVINW